MLKILFLMKEFGSSSAFGYLPDSAGLHRQKFWALLLEGRFVQALARSRSHCKPGQGKVQPCASPACQKVCAHSANGSTLSTGTSATRLGLVNSRSMAAHGAKAESIIQSCRMVFDEKGYVLPTFRRNGAGPLLTNWLFGTEMDIVSGQQKRRPTSNLRFSPELE